MSGAASAPVSVGLDPFGASGQGGGQRQVEDRDSLPLASRDTDGDDAIVSKFHSRDRDGDTEDLGSERKRQVLVEQREESRQFLVVVVAINGGFRDQGVQLLAGEPWGPGSRAPRGRRSGAPTTQDETSVQGASPCFDSPPVSPRLGKGVPR